MYIINYSPSCRFKPVRPFSEHKLTYFDENRELFDHFYLGLNYSFKLKPMIHMQGNLLSKSDSNFVLCNVAWSLVTFSMGRLTNFYLDTRLVVGPVSNLIAH